MLCEWLPKPRQLNRGSDKSAYNPDGVSQVTLDDDDQHPQTEQSAAPNNTQQDEYEQCQLALMEDFADMQKAQDSEQLKEIFRRAWNRAARYPDLQKDVMAVKDRRKKYLDAMQHRYEDDVNQDRQPIH